MSLFISLFRQVLTPNLYDKLKEQVYVSSAVNDDNTFALLGSRGNVHRLSGIWYFWPDHLCSLKRCFNMSLIHESDISTTPNSASEAAPSSVTHIVHGPNYNTGTTKSRNKVMWHQQSAPPPDLNDVLSCCYNIKGTTTLPNSTFFLQFCKQIVSLFQRSAFLLV